MKNEEKKVVECGEWGDKGCRLGRKGDRMGRMERKRW